MSSIAYSIEMSASPPTSVGQRKRGCLFYAARGALGIGIALLGLVFAGVIYQSVSTQMTRQNFAPRGKLYSVNGHQMHLVCAGEGSPAVILEAGGGAESSWWYWVQQQLSQHTRVCAYDRAGHGWSEPVSTSRDPDSIIGDLHALLQAAEIPPPYVVAGHSFGALWARIFAASYPDEVVGLVLVDSTFLIPPDFADRSEFDRWKSSNDSIKALEWAIYTSGLLRLTASGDFQRAGYPSDIIPEMTALRSANTVFDADYAEQVAAGWTLRQAAAAASNLGGLPMYVLWGGASPTAQGLFDTLREETSRYSRNSAARIIAGADHGAILGNAEYAGEVTEAILRVIGAAGSNQPLASE